MGEYILVAKRREAVKIKRHGDVVIPQACGVFSRACGTFSAMQNLITV